MIKFEKPDVWGWEHAIRGMRNPLNSWNIAEVTSWTSGVCSAIGFSPSLMVRS